MVALKFFIHTSERSITVPGTAVSIQFCLVQYFFQMRIFLKSQNLNLPLVFFFLFSYTFAAFFVVEAKQNGGGLHSFFSQHKSSDHLSSDHLPSLTFTDM